ncbi:hypothetical protein [Paracoccus tegillarcae]|uniref:Ca-activated chloride channel family protein n=1 Tax=Paracoccus tegillarcae TaxID=1529068 RepID=A0A2K9EJ64_9RHOB|nr:hypothetical protein [Paracoccus tegillarcae]AUH35048.1 hypothetical protein CUV01_18190 [Paracoccus tegillarcae]
MRRVLLIALAGLLCLAIAGPQGWARLALRAGGGAGAAPLLADPAARGVALYRAGEWDAADAAFADAGRTETYNRGLSLAATGDYPLSVAYFDAVLFSNPADAEARRNRDLVAAMYPPARGDSFAPGRLAGAGGLGQANPDEQIVVNTGTQDADWRQMMTARGIAASDDWLATISDDPGEFLALRLLAEYRRRETMGLIRPREGQPW